LPRAGDTLTWQSRIVLYEGIAGLPVEIESVSLERRALETGSGFTRATTTVTLRGGGEEGVGEDVVYDPTAHDDPPVPPLEGSWASFDELSARLGELELFREPPAYPVYRSYRRWAYESAALDLALRQAGRSLAEAIGREHRRVRFVASPRTVTVPRWLELYPELRFKLDPVSAWDDEVVEMLVRTGAVDVCDLKGAYRGTQVDQPPDPRLYRLVAERFPDSWIEDPNLDDDPDCAAILEPYHDRITWDAVLHSVADIEGLPFAPRTINVKPSRFGSLRELFGVYEYCEAKGISMYGGGQFELGPGRGQIQLLASFFHPEGSNDVAPGGYNSVEPVAGLEASPLDPRPARVGFRREA
jgi:L-alanine-DL-glutamate epimerase-like enolase superfamily enzyme